MNLLDLLLSPDKSNHALAIEMAEQWSKAEWLAALNEVINYILDEKEGVVKFSFIYMSCYGSWYIGVKYLSENKLTKAYWALTYDSESLILLEPMQIPWKNETIELKKRDKPRYLGDKTFKEMMKKIKQAIYKSLDNS